MSKDFELKENWKFYYHKYMNYHATCTTTHPPISSTCNITTTFDVGFAKGKFLKSIADIDFVILARNIQNARGLPNFENESILKYFHDLFKGMTNHEYEVMKKIDFNQYKNFNSIFEEHFKKNNIKTLAKNLNKNLNKKNNPTKTIKI